MANGTRLKIGDLAFRRFESYLPHPNRGNNVMAPAQRRGLAAVQASRERSERPLLNSRTCDRRLAVSAEGEI